MPNHSIPPILDVPAADCTAGDVCYLCRKKIKVGAPRFLFCDRVFCSRGCPDYIATHFIGSYFVGGVEWSELPPDDQIAVIHTVYPSWAKSV